MGLREDKYSAQKTGQASSFASTYAVFQALLVTFGNAFFLWLCVTMHRKAHPQAPEQLLAVGCVTAAVLALLAPLAWLWYKKQDQQDGPMPPGLFMRYTGTSIHISEAFVILGLFLFFGGAPVAVSASVPTAALVFDALLLLPWVISDRITWGSRRN